MEPRHYAWVVPGRVAVAERPGGGGRAHRRDRRAAEQDWWRDQGVDVVISCMPSTHGLLEHALAGFAVRWHPVPDAESAPDRLRKMGTEVVRLADAGHVVLVHGDAATEWLAAVDAALRLALGTAGSPAEALRAAAADGLPVGSLAIRLLEGEAAAAASPAAWSPVAGAA